MRRLLLGLAAMLAAASPAGAQVRVAVDGRMQDVPAGMIRTVSFTPGGRQIVRDEPFAGVAIPGAATISTTETVDEDEDGRVIARSVVTRIEPVAMTAAAIPPGWAPPPREPIFAEAAADNAVADDAAIEDRRPMVVRRDPATGHFVATVRINGVPVRAIVDTGAQRTVLSADDARTTGADRDVVRTTPMAGIGGLTMLAVARLRSMQVGGQALGSFDACIGQAGIPYTLLGQTEIARLGRIVIEDGVMTITPRAQVQMAAR